MNTAEKMNKTLNKTETKSKLNDLSYFIRRHIGITETEVSNMLDKLGFKNLDAFIEALLPDQIKMQSSFNLKSFEEPLTEEEALAKISKYAKLNKVHKSYIGQGYYNTHTPGVILRNVFENPGWYTQYTPYQPEISQGRLEALLNYQTLVCDLTGLEIANASLLDEGTAAAEAMVMAHSIVSKKVKAADTILVSDKCHPQTIAVVCTRAQAYGLKVKVVSNIEENYCDKSFAAIIQYPDTYGEITNFKNLADSIHNKKGLLICATDLLALTLLEAPGKLGADIALGNSQRFGVPLGFGGPHAAFFSCKDEFKRLIPGRLVGVSKDVDGKNALRLALQTREQHIRREKATSNICTAQVLLANIAGMYAVYHGPEGLKNIARRVTNFTSVLAKTLKINEINILNNSFFDTLTIEQDEVNIQAILKRASEKNINLCILDSTKISISIDETTTNEDIKDLFYVFTGSDYINIPDMNAIDISDEENSNQTIPKKLKRESNILENPVFNLYHTETEFLRYIKRLESKDLSLATSMIPLGSCTMKLNATSEMIPVTFPEFSNIHPFVPVEQAKGYQELFKDLEEVLAEITGFDGTSLQPNAGSQGEYTGLLVIRAYHHARNEKNRNICLIPKSAHGTNPASAVMAGFKVVVVNCDDEGNIDISDLDLKIEKHKDNLGALMVTYPSTHGVFEDEIKNICAKVHNAGGQVYLDGANLNALVGLVKVAEIGGDVVHFNLHKTFCIPHGGGGPGMGPISVKAHLKPFLPGHPLVEINKEVLKNGPVSAAPYGSASILPISWMYIAMMGAKGLRYASEIAILNANYIAASLSDDYKILYTGQNNLVAHECIIDLREFKQSANIEVDDIAKRLMDYGFHAPTVSWPVAGTIMIEPTESESQAELDRFINAMKAIRKEISEIESGAVPKEENILKNAPHTAEMLLRDEWKYSYSREQAAYPNPKQRDYKFWPTVRRIDNVFGDRNIVCTCPDISEYVD